MRKLYLIMSIFICLSLCGCTQNSAEEYTKTVFAMDTVMDLKTYSVNGDNALEQAENEIKRIENLLDRGNENSEVYKINNNKSAVVSTETSEIINTALSVSAETDGAFDITIAPVIDLWGFYGNEFRVPADDELQAALASVDYKAVRSNGSNISIPENTCIDLGGIGKGYTSDMIVKTLKENNINSAIISLGGNVHTIGKKPDGSLWTVGIANPQDSSQHIGKVKVSDKAVITSGGYQRYFEQDGKIYHHIINPATGMSADSGLTSVTIISDSGILADALSTALFVMGLEKSTEYWRGSSDFDAVFVDDNGKIYVTEGIKGNFECGSDYTVISR